jgi:hypothetical protein
MRYLATIEGTEHALDIEELATAGSFQIELGGKTFDADLRRVGPASFSIVIGNRSFDLDVVRDGDEVVVSSRGGTIRLTPAPDAHRRRQGA